MRTFVLGRARVIARPTFPRPEIALRPEAQIETNPRIHFKLKMEIQWGWAGAGGGRGKHCANRGDFVPFGDLNRLPAVHSPSPPPPRDESFNARSKSFGDSALSEIADCAALRARAGGGKRDSPTRWCASRRDKAGEYLASSGIFGIDFGQKKPRSIGIEGKLRDRDFT